MKIQNRFTGATIAEADTIQECIEKSRANLYGANLYRANLYRANLYGANLYGADL